MALGQFAIQSAIYSRLTMTLPLQIVLVSIYDEVQEVTATHLAIGRDSSIDYSTKDVDGSEYQGNFDIWSNIKAVNRLKKSWTGLRFTASYSLSVTGFNLINIRFEFGDILIDPDGITRHGVMRFRAIILGTS